jgi:broad specificity phosphatase PhoE
MKSITFIRHAETEANASGVWNGRSDGDLSDSGRESLEHLGRRLKAADFDVVVSSPLRRATETAAAFSDEVEVWDEFVEMDLGRWDGMDLDGILAESGDELKSALTTRTEPMGGTGESLEQVESRAVAAVDRLLDSLDDDGHAAVVTHGGLLQTLLHRHLRGRRGRTHAFAENSSLTRISWWYGRPRLASFNDTGHLGPRSRLVSDHLADGVPVIALVRHGQTRANIEGRWQGQGDWGLDEVGHRQAEALGDWYGRSATVYASPLGRAQETAGYVSLNGFTTIEELMELSMGDWEGLTSEEIAERWGETMERIYRHGVDLRRGGAGESWGELTARFRNAVHMLEPAEGEVTVAVAHGGAIRSYVASLTAVPGSHAEGFYTPRNTAVTHIAITEDGPKILDYAIAPHLETLT